MNYDLLGVSGRADRHGGVVGPRQMRLIYGHRTASISKMALLYRAPWRDRERERTLGEKKTRARQQSFGGVLLVAVALGGDGGGRSNGKNQICWQAERIYRWAPQSDETDSVTVGPKA